jgi:hypothetical protein
VPTWAGCGGALHVGKARLQLLQGQARRDQLRQGRVAGLQTACGLQRAQIPDLAAQVRLRLLVSLNKQQHVMGVSLAIVEQSSWGSQP